MKEDDEDSASQASQNGEEDGEEEEDKEEALEPFVDPLASDTYKRAVELMLDEDYIAERWTQEYCSAHVGFCVSVHKNWYFKSFGAMSSLLWHLEMGAIAVDVVGDGPLVVDLKTGDLTALGLNDGDVKVVGSKVIGYRSWSDNRHFEISAQSSLREPVEFVTKGLRGPE